MCNVGLYTTSLCTITPIKSRKRIWPHIPIGHSIQAKFLLGAYQRHATPGGKLSTVLELGCGPANHAMQLAKRGVQAWALDTNPNMLTYAAQKAAAAGVSGLTTVQGDMTQFNIKVRLGMHKSCGQPRADTKWALPGLSDLLPGAVMLQLPSHSTCASRLDSSCCWSCSCHHVCQPFPCMSLIKPSGCDGALWLVAGYGRKAGHGGVHAGHTLTPAG